MVERSPNTSVFRRIGGDIPIGYLRYTENNALIEKETLTHTQLEDLRTWNFINHLESNIDYYRRVVDVIRSTVAQGGISLEYPLDYIRILERTLENDTLLNKYIESRQWIGGDTHALFVSLFAKLITADTVSVAVQENESPAQQ